jgi:hypothetical protein
MVRGGPQTKSPVALQQTGLIKKPTLISLVYGAYILKFITKGHHNLFNYHLSKVMVPTWRKLSPVSVRPSRR